MRTLRNSLTTIVALLVSAALPAANQPGPAAGNAFFPLAAGNSWTYRCSAEGQFQFTKKVVIASAAALDGHHAYRSETWIDSDPSPLVSYLLVDHGGQVMTSLTPSLDKAELLMGAAPRTGDRFGNLSVVSIGQSSLKSLQDMQVMRLENFPADDPTLSDEKRMGWRGRSYGKGIGLLEEADGLGGECVLSAYQVKSGK